MRRKSMLAIVLVATLLVVAYACWPRKARREAVGPADSGRTIAEVAGLTYGKSRDDPAMVASGVARAAAMAYRDARRDVMTDGDWAGIGGS
jgi:hypothetical protein